jgi:imidazolonepropionase-like amidohydrolase
MKKFSACLLFILISIIACAQTPSAPPAPKPQLTYIKAGRLFDATGDSVKSNQVIVIQADRIKQVGGSEIAIPADATVIDLSRATVLPGLIDCHTHIGSRADHPDELSNFKDTPFDSAINGVVNARRTLNAGFTTIRDVGSYPFLAVDLRKNIDSGFVPGPRIVASGPGISITGGHGDLNNYSPQTSVVMFPQEKDFQIADSPDEVRHVVRAQMKYGVDVIKILASGGVLSKGDQPGAPQFTVDELRVAAETAHQGGRKIAAHAHGAQSIKDAITAGIDSMEHASLVDDEGISMAKQHGTYFVMDIYNDDFILGKAREYGMSEESVRKEKALGQLQRDNFAKAFKAGVKMAFGTDAGVYPHGDNAKQFFYMVKYGMSPVQAIRAATSSAADLIGRPKDVGSIQAGAFADIIAVTEDPFTNVRALENVSFVMKGGHVYKENGQPRD